MTKKWMALWILIMLGIAIPLSVSGNEPDTIPEHASYELIPLAPEEIIFDEEVLTFDFRNDRTLTVIDQDRPVRGVVPDLTASYTLFSSYGNPRIISVGLPVISRPKDVLNLYHMTVNGTPLVPRILYGSDVFTLSPSRLEYEDILADVGYPDNTDVRTLSGYYYRYIESNQTFSVTFTVSEDKTVFPLGFQTFYSELTAEGVKITLSKTYSELSSPKVFILGSDKPEFTHELLNISNQILFTEFLAGERTESVTYDPALVYRIMKSSANQRLINLKSLRYELDSERLMVLAYDITIPAGSVTTRLMVTYPVNPSIDLRHNTPIYSYEFNQNHSKNKTMTKKTQVNILTHQDNSFFTSSSVTFVNLGDGNYGYNQYLPEKLNFSVSATDPEEGNVKSLLEHLADLEIFYFAVYIGIVAICILVITMRKRRRVAKFLDEYMKEKMNH